MRDHVKQIVELAARSIDFPEPVLELGSYQVEGQVGYADLRPYFPGKKYIGCDFRQGPGVDRIEDPEAGFTFGDSTIGSVVTCDTFEHVFDVQKTVSEIGRVLAPQGMVLAVSVMHWPIHGYPHDYWRFTPECFRRLLAGFAAPLVLGLGDPLFPHTVLGLARKSAPLPEPLVEKLRQDILGLPPHGGSAWKSPRERSLEGELAKLRAPGSGRRWLGWLRRR